MFFFNRVAETISGKLQSSLQQLSFATQKKLRSNPLSGDIIEHIAETISNNMTGHFNNIFKYFTSDTHPEALIEQMADEISHKQSHSLEELMQNLERKKPIQLEYDYHRDVRKEISEQERSRREWEQEENSNPLADQQIQIAPTPAQQPPETPLLIIEDTRKNGNEKIALSHLQTPIKSHSSILIQKQNPQKSAFIKSELIQKRDIVKELQLRRQMTLDRQKKSQKMKSRLIKLQPLARQKDQETKQKQTKDKLANAIDFFNSMQLSKESSNHKPTEWKQQRIAPIYTPSKSNGESIVSQLRYSNKKKLQQLGFSPARADRSFVVGTSKKERSRSRQDIFVLPKPLPYNLYTINQTKNEMFKLKLI